MIKLFNRKQEKLQRQAADWYVLLNDTTVDAQTVRRHQQWLAEDSRHAAEYERIQALWSGVDVAQDAALDHLYALQAQKIKASSALPAGRVAPLWQWGVLAACLLLVFVAGWTMRPSFPPVDNLLVDRTYVTTPGERRSILLSDGSTLLVNGASKVRVNMMPDMRRLDLLQGEAFFDVKSDPARPFVVFARGINVRAVGTQFNINLLGEKVDVTVIEGVVAVTGFAADRATPKNPDKIELSVGQRLSFRSATEIPTVRQVPVDRAIAWQDRKIYFDSASLEDVVMELSRNYPGSFQVMIDEPVTVRVSGVFEVGNLEATLKALEHVLPVRFKRKNEQLVHVLPGDRADGAP